MWIDIYAWHRIHCTFAANLLDTRIEMYATNEKKCIISIEYKFTFSYVLCNELCGKTRSCFEGNQNRKLPVTFEQEKWYLDFVLLRHQCVYWCDYINQLI